MSCQRAKPSPLLSAPAPASFAVLPELKSFMAVARFGSEPPPNSPVHMNFGASTGLLTLQRALKLLFQACHLRRAPFIRRGHESSLALGLRQRLRLALRQKPPLSAPQRLVHLNLRGLTTISQPTTYLSIASEELRSFSSKLKKLLSVLLEPLLPSSMTLFQSMPGPLVMRSSWQEAHLPAAYACDLPRNI